MLEFSELSKTWIIDVDGTIVKHNGYKIDGFDTLLEGVKEFFATIPPNDKIILLTARKNEYLEDLKFFLKNISYSPLLFFLSQILQREVNPSELDFLRVNSLASFNFHWPQQEHFFHIDASFLFNQ